MIYKYSGTAKIGWIDILGAKTLKYLSFRLRLLETILGKGFGRYFVKSLMEVITYGDIAKIIAKENGKGRMSAQAVGGAVGHNPISIIIPCHRVVGSNGSLTGYAGGIETKIKLLKHEGVNMDGLFTPKHS